MIKRNKFLLLALIIIIIAAVVFLSKTKNKSANEVMQQISPTMGSIKAIITATATVQPQNRLEIKPSIAGRLDKILVKEGDKVTEGQILAWMSSTERAALLDAAKASGPEALKYWEEVYKSSPLISPINGDVIVCTNYPGQTVTTADAIVVLSDHLIVKAQIDETDIGKVKLNQQTTIILDAYPQIKIEGTVNHIYYESTTVNNVVIYYVDILPEKVPDIFRSGMSATVEIVEKEKKDVLMLPLEAVMKDKEGSYVLMAQLPGPKPTRHTVEIGSSDEKNVEIISGLTADYKVLVAAQKYQVDKSAQAGTNPFMPSRKKK
jgi:macrolide-specific efflux system membrane fusion protein